MAEYVLLRIEDERSARELVRDIENNPSIPLLSPSQENEVYAVVIKTFGEVREEEE